MSSWLIAAQVVVSLLLIAVLMLQVKGTSLSGFFGGESQGPRFSTKRGLERILFQATIVLAGAFLLISMLVVRLQ
jgi:protein translocase SecG subunit